MDDIADIAKGENSLKGRCAWGYSRYFTRFWGCSGRRFKSGRPDQLNQ